MISLSVTAPSTFKFRLRRETVDWLRIEKVDVDQVASQVDVNTLQEHVANVTFCSLEGERCLRCRAPIDPALAKVLRLSQLTVEWLLHCQEVLEVNVHAAEQQRAAAEERLAAAEAQRRTQEEQIRELRVELKQRKKIIHSQQKMIATQTIHHKCLHCEKDFLNITYLQNHMQRRHPDEFFASELLASQKMKAKFDRLKSEISGLKEQIVRQQQELEAKEALEAQKDAKMEKFRDDMRAETELVQSRKDRQWKHRLEDMKSRHESEKKQLQEELSRMCRSVLEEQESSKWQQEQLTRSLEEKSRSLEEKSRRLEEKSRRLEEKEQSIQTMKEQKDQLQEELSRMRRSVLEEQESSKRQQESSKWQQEQLTRRLQEKSRRLQEKEQTIQTMKEQLQEELSRMRCSVLEEQESSKRQQESSKRQQEELTRRLEEKSRRLEEKSRRLEEKEQSIQTMKEQKDQDLGCEKNQDTRSPWKKLKARLRGCWRQRRTGAQRRHGDMDKETALDIRPHTSNLNQGTPQWAPRTAIKTSMSPTSSLIPDEEPQTCSDVEDDKEPHPRSESEEDKEPQPWSDVEDDKEPHPWSDSKDAETPPEPRRDKPALTLIHDEDDEDAQYDYYNDGEEDEDDNGGDDEDEQLRPSRAQSGKAKTRNSGRTGKEKGVAKPAAKPARKAVLAMPPGGVRIPIAKME